MRMTNITIAKLRPRDVRYEVSDPQQRGLRVAVQPVTGTKKFWSLSLWWRLRKLTLQAGISLAAAARKEAADALYEVAQGRDPGAAKARAKEEQRAAAADTLEGVAAEFFKREGEAA